MSLSARRDSLAGRLRAELAANRSLLSNAGSMVGTTLVTSILGVAFWFVAAQHFSQAAVGVAGAAVSAMILLGFIGALGLGTLLMGELRGRDDYRALLNAALLIALGAGFALGLAFALIAPLISSNLDPLDSTPIAVFAFALGAGLTSLAYVLDQSLIGLLKGGLQLARNTAFAAIKLLALIAIAAIVADPGAPWIYASWAAGIGLSLILLARFFRGHEGGPMRPNFREIQEMRGLAASHATVNLALETADLAMPILVLTILSPTANAGFYIAWLIVGFLIMIPFSLSSVAYAMGSAEPALMNERFRFTFGLSLGLAGLADVVLIAGATPILEIFGPGYADVAATPMRILALGVFPLIVKTHYVAVHRVQKTLRRAVPIAWAGTVLELGGGALGAALGGLSGVAIGWLGGLLIEALVMGGDVRRALSRRGSAAVEIGAGGSPAPR